MKIEPRRIDKPWGYELIWAETDDYVGKILHVDAGEALSLQYHEIKDETLHLLSGRMRFWAAPLNEELRELVFEEGESFRVRAGTVHRMEAITDCDILEVSTNDLEDVVRLDDRYGRVPDDDAGSRSTSGSDSSSV